MVQCKMQLSGEWLQYARSSIESNWLAFARLSDTPRSGVAGTTLTKAIKCFGFKRLSGAVSTAKYIELRRWLVIAEA